MGDQLSWLNQDPFEAVKEQLRSVGSVFKLINQEAQTDTFN